MRNDNDPTRIDIATEWDTDPRKARMNGRTTHGNLSFDCPIITKIGPNLWMGGVENGLVLPAHIQHLVSLYRWERYTVTHELKSWTEVKMYDSETTPDAEQIETLVRWVQNARRSGPVLLHCQAGLNRSGIVAASVLMDDGLSADDAIQLLRSKRSPAVLCNRAFEKWLRTR